MHLTDENKAEAIESIQLIVFSSIKYDGIYSGSARGSEYITKFPEIFTYASYFWSRRGKPHQIVFDSITESGDIYYTHMDKSSVLKPGTNLILRDTVYDTIWGTFAESETVDYANLHIKIDTIVNLGYLPFE